MRKPRLGVSRIVDALAAAHQAFKDAAREAHEALKDAEAATAREREEAAAAAAAEMAALGKRAEKIASGPPWRQASRVVAKKQKTPRPGTASRACCCGWRSGCEVGGCGFLFVCVLCERRRCEVSARRGGDERRREAAACDFYANESVFFSARIGSSSMSSRFFASDVSGD